MADDKPFVKIMNPIDFDPRMINPETGEIMGLGRIQEITREEVEERYPRAND